MSCVVFGYTHMMTTSNSSEKFLLGVILLPLICMTWLDLLDLTLQTEICVENCLLLSLIYSLEMSNTEKIQIHNSHIVSLKCTLFVYWFICMTPSQQGNRPSNICISPSQQRKTPVGRLNVRVFLCIYQAARVLLTAAVLLNTLNILK